MKRFSSHRNLVHAALVALVALLSASPSHGYCRLRSCLDSDDEECRRSSRGCVSEGKLLSHRSACLSFAIAKGHARKLGLTNEEFDDLVQVAFERWRAVDCGRGGYPSFFVQSLGVVDAEAAYACEEPSLNASVWFVNDDWRYEAAALGNTATVFDVDSGEIVDADVELNRAGIKAKAKAGEEWDALLAIATHEAGHVLGLDHSEVEGALMSAEYAEGELVGRELTEDDVDAVCDLYPPDEDFTECRRAELPEGALSDEACTGAILDAHYADDGEAGGGNDTEASSCRVGHGRGAGVGLLLGGAALITMLRRRRSSLEPCIEATGRRRPAEAPGRTPQRFPAVPPTSSP